MEGTLAKRGRVSGNWQPRAFRLTTAALSCVLLLLNSGGVCVCLRVCVCVCVCVCVLWFVCVLWLLLCCCHCCFLLLLLLL
jgi:hypothetical protein